jgi:hypothetical protein
MITLKKLIKGRSAFQDDGITIVVVEFWANFNNDNSFKEWEKLKGVKYYRCDIAKSPMLKKIIKYEPYLILLYLKRDMTNITLKQV